MNELTEPKPIHPMPLSSWQKFVDSPVCRIRGHRLAAVLGVPGNETAAAVLARSPRFNNRLTALLVDHHDLVNPGAMAEPGEADAVVLSLGPDQTESLIRLCGAIHSASVFASEIRGPRVAELKSRFGEHLFATALAHRVLAYDATPESVDMDTLEERIEREGAACVEGWLSSQPPALVAWLRLGLADDERLRTGLISQASRGRGCDITRAAAHALANGAADKPEESGADTAEPRP